MQIKQGGQKRGCGRESNTNTHRATKRAMETLLIDWKSGFVCAKLYGFQCLFGRPKPTKKPCIHSNFASNYPVYVCVVRGKVLLVGFLHVCSAHPHL